MHCILHYASGVLLNFGTAEVKPRKDGIRTIPDSPAGESDPLQNSMKRMHELHDLSFSNLTTS